MGRSPPPRSPARRRRDTRSRSRSAPRRGRSRGRSPSRSPIRSRSTGRRVNSRDARSPPRRARTPPRSRRARSYSSSSSASSRNRSRSRSRSRRGSVRRDAGHRNRRSVSSRSRSSSASSRSRSRSRSASSARASTKRDARSSSRDAKREPKRARSDTPLREPKREQKRSVTPKREPTRDTKPERTATPSPRDAKSKRSVTPSPRDAKRDAQREVQLDEATQRKRERSPSADVKRSSERAPKTSKRDSASRSTAAAAAIVDTPSDVSTAANDRDQSDTVKRSSERVVDRSSAPKRERRRSTSGERTPPRKAASNAKRVDANDETTPSRAPAATTSRRPHTRSPSKSDSSSDDSASGQKTPPRKSKPTRSSRKQRSSSSERTSKRKTKTRRKRSDRKRRNRSSSRSSSSDSSSDSASDRTPPRRKHDRRNDRSATKVRKSDPTATVATAVSTAPTTTAPSTTTRVNLFADDAASGRTGGVYVPPFKLAQMRAAANTTSTDPNDAAHQRATWDALRKSINGLINKVNVSNLATLVPELFQENLVRARGLLARAVMKAQLASPGFTHIYAALVAVVNTKMPETGELVVKRVVHRFRRAFKRGDKVVAIALVRFIAHLVNQQVVHELLALEVLTLLLANPTDDSVEVAVNFTKEVGQLLAELCPDGLRAIFERFRGILHEGRAIDKRVQYTIEGLFAIRKGGFADYPAVHAQLDLVESGDQITHETTLDDVIDREEQLDVFRVDPDFAKNEAMWAAIKKEILGESDSDSDDDGSDGSDDDASDDDEGRQQAHTVVANGAIQDLTEQDLVNLRRTIYLTIMSSISHEECAHKLLKLNIRAGQEKEICAMLLECCSQERTYLRYYGLLGQRFCLLKREYQDAFDACFAEQYALIHRLETNKLRNVAKFFAHLLLTDALPWTVFEYIRLNEDETTSSSRIFIKILCQELSEHLGLKTLKLRFLDALMAPTFAGLFPTDNPRNTRFAINFFTSIGLGGLTTDLREHLKNAPKLIMAQTKAAAPDSSSDSDSSDSDSSDSSSSGSSSSGSSSSDSSSDSD